MSLGVVRHPRYGLTYGSVRTVFLCAWANDCGCFDGICCGVRTRPTPGGVQLRLSLLPRSRSSLSGVRVRMGNVARRG